MFSLFINDIEDGILNSKILLYADDLKSSRPIRQREDSDLLQMDLNSLVKRSEENDLPFNINKCEKIRLQEIL